MIGPEVMIFTANHNYSTSDYMNESGYNYLPVIIEDNVWIGARVIILPGVKIETGAIVAAGSIVPKGILAANCIYAGNPAKLIKNKYE
ncbi:acyltransferase [Providencia sp. PROV272]|uniref:acyltransferase n=1 Tax=Providencia sp. PROV272 TaxID=2936800 RepID=UPI003CFBB2B0